MFFGGVVLGKMALDIEGPVTDRTIEGLARLLPCSELS